MTIALPVDQQRADGRLGASRAAAALGLDPYTSPITVWRELRGLDVPERPAFVQEAAEWGQALEPIVRGKYALTKPAAVFVPTKSLELEDWLRATPDGFVVLSHPDLEHFGDIMGATHEWGSAPADNAWIDRVVYRARVANALGLYQGKTCSAYKADEWLEGVPAPYEVQVRVEMAVTNLPWCDVACLVGGQRLVGPFRIERDAALEDRILTDLRAFWRCVRDGIEPSPDHTAAWREHVSERMQATKVAIVPSHEQMAILAQWKAARAELAKLKRQESELKTKLLLELSAAGATAYELGGDVGRVTAYRTGAKAKWKDYAISLGGGNTVPDRFKGKPGNWTLRAPWGEEDGDGE